VNTSTAVSHRGKLPIKSGEVTTGSKKIVIVEVTVNRAAYWDNETAEVHLVLNGRTVLRMHPHRAARLGLLSEQELDSEPV